MFQIKNIKKTDKKSKAQHVVELALMLPIFIICFSFTFQLMVETFSKYKFSYIFTNSVRNTINNPEIFNDIADIENFSITDIVQNELEDELMLDTNRIPFTNVTVETVISDETVFFQGVYQLETVRLFFSEAGNEYFYFTIPVNAAYTSPIVLNRTEDDIETYFDSYFQFFADKFDAAGENTDIENSDDTETGDTEDNESDSGTDDSNDATGGSSDDLGAVSGLLGG